MLARPPLRAPRRCRCPHLSLEAARLPLAAGLLELAALGADVRRGAAARDAGRLAEVALRLTGLHGAAKEDGALAKGRAHGQLVEGDALTASLGDAGTGGLGEAQRAYGELWHLVHALVIGDLADDNGDLAVLVRHVLDEPRDRDGRLVAAGHVQALADDLTERGNFRCIMV